MKEGVVIKTIQNKGEMLIFRYPRWQDVPAYVRMCNILHDELVMASHSETDFAEGCRLLSNILVDLETGKRSLVLLETDGQIVGEGSMIVRPPRQTGTLGIKIIGKYHRRGLGTEMMYLLEEEARKLGLRRTYLTVWALNEAALNLYRKVGYRKVGRLPDWCSMVDKAGDQIVSDLLQMVKDI